MPSQTEVLVVGAGPTGLVLALWLTRQGVGVRIVDQSAGPGETSRAMAVQARTLELYRQLGLAETVVAAGLKNPSMNLWAQGRHRAQIVLGEAGLQLTPFPFILMYPQDHHERVLVQRLAELGVEVERNTELLGFEQRGEQVEARLKLPDGLEQACVARYLAGCDGARSTTRKQLGMDFEGGTYKHVFYVADVRLSGLEPAEEGHISLDNADFVLVLPYGHGMHRLIGAVRDERAQRAETLVFDDVRDQAMDALGLKVEAVNWFSTYRVHHRVSERFRQGRAFLLGDAAHVHSPVGGQGMNTGIVDAINLAWKLAAVLKGLSSDALLDSYEQERRGFALALVDSTDRLFSFVTAEGGFADFVRVHIAPRLVSMAYRIDSVREIMFRLISQTGMHYRDSALSKGEAGEVRGGDRLPWVAGVPQDNHACLSEIAWQVHVYGSAPAALGEGCRRQGIALHEFPWTEAHQKAGFARDAAYLVRPDAYVALADPGADPQVLQSYLERQGLVFAP